MFFHFLAQTHLDFGSEITNIIRVAPDETKDLMEIVLMRILPADIINRLIEALRSDYTINTQLRGDYGK
jgi:hypothetical protein